MTTPPEVAVAELLRAWDADSAPSRWPAIYRAVEALRAAHANHVEGEEYQRGRRDGAAEELAAALAEVDALLGAVQDAMDAMGARRSTASAQYRDLRRRYFLAWADGIHRVRDWLTARAAPTPSREEPHG